MTNTDLENALEVMIGSQEAEAVYIGSSLLWSNTPVVPYDCKIEYIESSGTQYIDTGIIINGPYKAEIEFETPSALTSNYSKLMGVGNDENASYLYCIIEVNGNRLGLLKCSNRDDEHISSIYASVSSSTINTISIESPNSNTMNVILNEESLGSVSNCGATYSKAASGSLYLFTLHNTLNRNGELLSPDTTGGFVSYKLYSFKFYLGNLLIRDMIPVRRGQIGYLYDKVSGLLFGNSGTGSFILGPDIVEIEYLQATGTLYINTDYLVWNYGLSGEIKMQRTGDSTGEKAYIGRTISGGFDLYTKSDSGIGLWIDRGDNNFDIVSGSQYFDKNIHIVLFGIVLDGTSYISVNGDIYSKTDSLGTRTKSPILLFSHKGYYNSEGRIYYCKLYDEGTLVLDLIPVRIGQVGYMYDKVSNQLFGNSGSGDFVLGPDKGGADFLDILYADSNGNLSFTSEVLPVSEGKTPIALCITKQRFFGENEKARWISLKYMNYTTPEAGSLTAQGMCWGNYNIDISTITNLSKAYGGNTWGYLTADWITGTGNKIPSLFTENKEWNISTLGTINLYAVTDIDGKNKTEKIIATATAQSSWETDIAITNEGGEGYAPAACCCARYHTLGTQAGNWYLGAGGEMSIVVVKRNEINTKLAAINTLYPNNCITSLDNNEHWTSTEDNSKNVYNINTNDGGIGGNAKNTNKYVIAMLQY